MRHAFAVCLLALPALIASTDGLAETTNSPAITAPEVLDHIKVLAGDAMEGREAGTPGGRRAADWIAEVFRALGIPGAGPDGAYFQPVPIPALRAGSDCVLEILKPPGTTRLALDTDYVPFAFAATKEAMASVAFAGYGITAPKLDRDDYADVDAKGRIVLIFRHEPHEGTPRGQTFRRAGHSSFDRKIRNAAAHGAVGVIVVNDPIHHEKDELPGLLGGRRVPLPAVFAKRAVAASILGVDDLAAVQRDLDAGRSVPRVRDVGVRMKVALDRTPREGHNVAALLGGSDPALADEVVIVGAHFDHLGRGGFGSRSGAGAIHNGADDNASGTAAVLEIAECLAQVRPRPRRSVMFVLFTGEEKGLLGSRQYVKTPLRPLAKTVAMLNLDMVGRSRNGGLFVGGVGTSPGFQSMLEPLVAREELNARYGNGGAAPSDNTPFYRSGIPTLFFFTGIHGDYHRPTDDWDRINADGAARVTRVAADAIRTIASADERPEFRRAVNAYVGVMPGRGGEGALIQRVMPGAPAGAAGLRDGDRIVQANGVPIASWSDLRKLLAKARPGDEMSLEVVRTEARVELKLVLGER